MCMSTPKVKPVATPPMIQPEAIDEQVLSERDKQRRRLRGSMGRQSTLLTGPQSSPPTAPIKTALGQ